ncbi:hypothetical protein SAMN04487785_10913 [Dyella jiangningensis]|uniref:hypothetical protein n=1 Tax=Dyella sp. AtDHG13 TaxID=1938897 RepID=UPI0008806670|nr:hypothetical protein [Dyella sp. AtDHG13]PXV56890.1 hypothetical protein BDW41_10812 [Dyella sp. AtDHG13]SDK59905.1 hypothetical protein SAMN04487785_10913 [Dyella jiangningensis]
MSVVHFQRYEQYSWKNGKVPFELAPGSTVIDKSRQIGVSRSSFFYDDARLDAHYTYSAPGIQFDFFVTFEERVSAPIIQTDGTPYTPLQTTACHVHEDSVRQGLKEAMGVDTLSEADFSKVKSSLLEGMTALITRAGSYKGAARDVVIDML